MGYRFTTPEPDCANGSPVIICRCGVAARNSAQNRNRRISKLILFTAASFVREILVIGTFVRRAAVDLVLFWNHLVGRMRPGASVPAMTNFSLPSRVEG
jgi:hypothetical protein